MTTPSVAGSGARNSDRDIHGSRSHAVVAVGVTAVEYLEDVDAGREIQREVLVRRTLLGTDNPAAPIDAHIRIAPGRRGDAYPHATGRRDVQPEEAIVGQFVLDTEAGNTAHGARRTIHRDFRE